MHRQVVNIEPSDFLLRYKKSQIAWNVTGFIQKKSKYFDFSSGSRLKLCVSWDIGYNIQAYDLFVDLNLKIFIAFDERRDVKAGLFENLSDRAVHLGFFFFHLAFRKSPAGFHPKALHQNHIFHRLVEYDGAIGRQRVFEQFPFGQNVVDIIQMLHQKRTMAKEWLNLC